MATTADLLGELLTPVPALRGWMAIARAAGLTVAEAKRRAEPTWRPLPLPITREDGTRDVTADPRLIAMWRSGIEAMAADHAARAGKGRR